ncbi:uncharacterized protein LOC128128466 isoform X2 [Lactuca sativa]|uniref:uncharacterized protein LOC128128466 isoform X2 n=1 Tax=Lactuca sativa TaxID=4236 RepID=UPI0022AF9369|nr:uncharacterized protein LOC128128466 isoform X2 [Lactuca sativa]
MVDSHRHLPLLVADAVVLVAVMFQPRLVAVAYAALMSLQLLLSVPRDGHACISQGCECVVASSSSEVWSFGLAGNQERAPPTPAAAGHHKVLSFQKRSSRRLQCTHHLFSLGCLYSDIFDSC